MARSDTFVCRSASLIARSAATGPVLPAGRGRFLLCWLGLLLLLQVGAWGAPVAPSVPEYNAKAAYLLLFSRYVEWPPAAFANETKPIVIGVLGANPFGDVLEKTVAGQHSQQRPVEFRPVGTLEEAAACHIVFIGRQEARQQPAWLVRLRDLPVLTVTETDESLAQGAVVAFVMEAKPMGAKLRFDVSLPAMQRAGLRISAQMLVSARQVQRGAKEGG